MDEEGGQEILVGLLSRILIPTSSLGPPAFMSACLQRSQLPLLVWGVHFDLGEPAFQNWGVILHLTVAFFLNLLTTHILVVSF